MLDLEIQFNINEAIEVLEMNGYKVITKMGKGGFGKCYRVKNMKNKNYETTFVCKITNDKGSFERELNILKCADNVNIVRCYDYFEDSYFHKYYYLILEDCSHGNLLERIKHRGKLGYQNFVSYGFQLSQALAFLHNHCVCHFDIKPSNVFLTEYDTIKLGDFGLSQMCEPGKLVNYYEGTKYFTAPEVLDRKSYDPFKADIYSLGVTLYCMISGKLPFSDYDDFEDFLKSGEVELYQEFSQEITNFLRKCISLAPSSRPTIQEVLKFFETIATPSPLSNGIPLIGSSSVLNMREMSPRIICPLEKHKHVLHNVSMTNLEHLFHNN